MGFLEENERKRMVVSLFEGDGWILLKIREKVMVVRERRKKVRNVNMREEGTVAARVRGNGSVLLIGFYMWVTGLPVEPAGLVRFWKKLSSII